MEAGRGSSDIPNPDRRLKLVQLSPGPLTDGPDADANIAYIQQRAHLLVACAWADRQRHQRSVVHGPFLCDQATHDTFLHSNSGPDRHAAFTHCYRSIGDSHLHTASHSDTDSDCSTFPYTHSNPNDGRGRYSIDSTGGVFRRERRVARGSDGQQRQCYIDGVCDLHEHADRHTAQ